MFIVLVLIINIVTVDDIKGIHKYLMKKNDIV